MKRLLWSALSALVLLPAFPVHAAPIAQPPTAGGYRVTGTAVLPRTIEFSQLPPRTGPEYSGPVSEGHPEGVYEEAEREVEALKINPKVIGLAELGDHLTIVPGSAVGAKGGLEPFAPTLGTGFEGITQGPYIPSEPTVAAGPLNVFTAGNVTVTVTNKDGSSRVETDGATFFGVPVAEGAISDAQCYYDALRGRFVAVAFTEGTTPSNYSNFYVAISKTNDARGAWWLYKYDMSKDGSTPTTNWSDYESIGITDDKLVLTGQQFTFSTNAYTYQKIRVIDRAALYAGTAAGYVDFVNFAPPAGGDTNDNFVTKCARNLSPDATAHLLCVRTGSGSRVTYREITGPPSAPVLTSGNLITVTAYSAPPDAAQKGSATLVATNDCRPSDFYWRNGVLIVSWHTSVTLGGTVSGIRLFRLRTADRVVLTDETLAASGTFLYYPAVTVDSVGTIFLGFDRSSSTEFPSCYVTGKRRSDATIQAPVLLKAGLSSTAQTRWGDYTGIDNDASLAGPGGSSAWYAGQWTKGTNTFGTWINKLTFTYGQVAGSVQVDCDGSAATTTDRTPYAGATVTLLQGATTIGTTTTDAGGAYSFGYLEGATYDVVVTPPGGGSAVDAIAGAGATTQTRVSATDLQMALTNAQTSTGNTFVVATSHPAPATSNIAPAGKTVGDPGFTMTVNGSNFTACSTVQLDGANRATTFVNAGQLTALIPAGDMVSAGTHAITVVTPTPGGGTSNAQSFVVSGGGDTQPPVVTVTSPVGGESWQVGSSHAITWTATDNGTVTGVDLAWSSDGGTTFPNAIATGIANSGTFAWTLPGVLTSTARVRVVAHDGGGNVGADSSHANFAIAGWTVTASAGANGAIAPAGTLVVADGATPGFTITPNSSYHVADVLVNGVSVGAVTAYTFPAVHANQTIAASFAINTYTLAVTIVGSGTVAKAPDQATYDAGSVVQLTPTPAASWNFNGWSGDATGAANPLSVTMDGNKAITATFGQHIYTWNQTGSAAWGTAANWTPTRTTPATDDVLIFSGGGAVTATGVPAQTIGVLQVAGATNVALQSAAAATLTIAGGAGADLDVQSGSTLQLNGTSALTVAIGAGATGAIAGSVGVTAAAHRVTATDPGSLAFLAGGQIATGTGFTGNVFGTTSLNSVVFQAGSRYVQVAGANPFGASAPGSVVQFQAGSRYRLDGAVTPSMSGRAYADFECNIAGTQSPTGATACTLDSLVVTQGTLNLNLTGGVTIRGDVHVRSGATLGFNPASGTPTFALAGPAAQQVDLQGTFTNTPNAAVAINNAAGVTLASNWTLRGPLAFTAGRVTTGANTLGIDSTGTVTGAAQGTGWVAGNLRRRITTGASTIGFDIGDASTYAPVTLATTFSVPFDLTASTSTPDHPNLGTSDLNAAKSVNRWWTLAGAPGPLATDITFQYAAADVDAGANTGAFLVRRYAAGWNAATVGARTATSTQATGVSALGDFAIAEAAAYTITASAGAGGSITPSGAVSVAAGANQGFAIAADPGFHIVDVLVDAVSQGAIASYTFTSVSASHTIAASFAASDRTLTINLVGNGSVARSPNLPSYPNGSTVQLTATPAAGWAFAAWTGALTGATNPQNLLMDGDKTVTATFTDATAPTITVTAPNGNEILAVGGPATLSWTASDNVAVTRVDLLLSRTGTLGTFDTLVTGLPNTGSYSWTVTGPSTNDARLRAVAYDAAGLTGTDASDESFTISEATGVDGAPVTAFALSPVMPNPTRGGGLTVFALPRAAVVHASVIDVQGRELAVLASGEYAPGRYTLSFAGHERMSAGLYFVRVRVTGGPTMTRRFAVTR